MNASWSPFRDVQSMKVGWKGRLRKHYRDYSSQLVWECLVFPQEDVEEVTRENNVWAALHTPGAQNELLKNW